MAEALAWGAVAASSLVAGALLALARGWSDRSIGLVLGFGAGALISAVSFELAQEGFEEGGALPLAVGLALGAATYYALDGLLASRGTGRAKQRRSEASGGGRALALGALLDGVPEQLVLGLGLAATGSISFGLIAAIFVSNLPEAIGSAAGMRADNRPAAEIVGLWAAVALACLAATVGGYALADVASDGFRAGLNGFAAGALLVMLVDAMVPEAHHKAGRATGLVTVLGFAVAAGLSLA